MTSLDGKTSFPLSAHIGPKPGISKPSMSIILFSPFNKKARQIKDENMVRRLD